MSVDGDDLFKEKGPFEFGFNRIGLNIPCPLSSPYI